MERVGSRSRRGIPWLTAGALVLGMPWPSPALARPLPSAGGDPADAPTAGQPAAVGAARVIVRDLQPSGDRSRAPLVGVALAGSGTIRFGPPTASAATGEPCDLIRPTSGPNVAEPRAPPARPA